MLDAVESWSYAIYNWELVLAMGLLAVELVRDMVIRRFSLRRVLDTLASLSTQIPYYFAEVLIFGLAIVVYYTAYETVTPYQIPVNAWTVALALLAADFAYYWEHRWAHQIRVLWLSHAVHHSSRILNTAVAFRFGLFEGLWSLVVYLPLVLIGFHPLVVVFGELAVLAYQIWIHTEIIGRLGPLDRVLNTPSNHRVHHGCDEKYLDKNYGGILIVWDRLFGTYQAEEERPNYGLKRDFDSVNPFVVIFSEFPALIRDLIAARTFGEAFGYLLRRPGWRPGAALSPSPTPE